MAEQDFRVKNGLIVGTSIRANGSIGTAGQVLTSNGTAVYWTTPAASGVTSVGSGNGLTGGPITSTGSLSVLANTGIVANATGLYVNASYIATLPSNSATYLGTKLEGDLNVNSASVALTANNATNFGGQPNSFYTNGSNISTGSVAYARLTILANSGIIANATGIYVNANNGLIANSLGVFVRANTGLVANSVGLFVNSTYIGTLTANNATNAFGKTEGNLNVNSAVTALTANNSTNAFGKTENALNVNSAVTALTANNSTNFNGQPASFYANGDNITSGTIAYARLGILANTGIVANATGLYVNAGYIATITANNATFAYGKTEGNLNVNSAVTSLTANNSTNFDGQPSSYYVNASNISTGTLNNARLPSDIAVNSVNASLFSTTAFNANTTVVTVNGQLISNATPNAANNAGSIYLGNGTSNRIDFGPIGTGGPAFTTRTVGTKIVLYPNVNASQTDYAIGVESGAAWFSTPLANNTRSFKWYGATTLQMQLFGDGLLSVNGHIRPMSDNTYDLGSSSLRFANIYTGDLKLSNEGSNGNIVDGTTGSWTIQEGETDLYLINEKTGKKYKFKLDEV